MKQEINVDVLVLGDILCNSYIACMESYAFTGAGNSLEIDPANVPETVFLYGTTYNLSHAIVMDARGFNVKLDSICAPAGKAVFATGNIVALARGLDQSEYLTLNTI